MTRTDRSAFPARGTIYSASGLRGSINSQSRLTSFNIQSLLLFGIISTTLNSAALTTSFHLRDFSIHLPGLFSNVHCSDLLQIEVDGKVGMLLGCFGDEGYVEGGGKMRKQTTVLCQHGFFFGNQDSCRLQCLSSSQHLWFIVRSCIATCFTPSSLWMALEVAKSGS
ncbi:hypothetical protein BDP27DRAFT_106303 [Rhodocollybia butyracea]|uniref:Uncharacterized protein n=1 Tax=Rhodocollybia butyracea TaxID=206335 RepID=A0A9P5TWG9_9AGAR|nr:hypothetical protein BDP27DRAFT_106303 [Rhodocollybia butyracea]